MSTMGKAGLIIALLAASPAAADDAHAEAVAHEAVREALLERATLPAELGTRQDQGPVRAAHQRVAEEAERAAHSRAATHGARHSSEAHSGHDGDASAHGPSHGGSTMGGSGMDMGGDCHDPAENERTRNMHDGMPNGHDGPHGP